MIDRLTPYFRILRANLWIASIISMFIGLTFAFYTSQVDELTLTSFMLGILIVGPLVGGGAVTINQFFDYETDRRSSKKRNMPLVIGLIKVGYSLVYGLLLLFAALIAAFLINFNVLYITSFAVALSIVYSCPPVRLKKRPFLDSICNGICYGFLPTLVGWFIVSSWSWSSFIICIPLFFGYTAGHMLLAIPDIKDDQKFGIRTTAVILGYKLAVFAATSLFLVMTFLISAYIYLTIVPLTSIIIYPAIAYVFYELLNLFRKGERVRENVYEKLSIAFLIIALLFLVGLWIVVLTS